MTGPTKVHPSTLAREAQVREDERNRFAVEFLLTQQALRNEAEAFQHERNMAEQAQLPTQQLAGLAQRAVSGWLILVLAHFFVIVLGGAGLMLPYAVTGTSAGAASSGTVWASMLFAVVGAVVGVKLAIDLAYRLTR